MKALLLALFVAAPALAQAPDSAKVKVDSATLAAKSDSAVTMAQTLCQTPALPYNVKPEPKHARDMLKEFPTLSASDAANMVCGTFPTGVPMAVVERALYIPPSGFRRSFARIRVVAQHAQDGHIYQQVEYGTSFDPQYLVLFSYLDGKFQSVTSVHR